MPKPKKGATGKAAKRRAPAMEVTITNRVPWQGAALPAGVNQRPITFAMVNPRELVEADFNPRRLGAAEEARILAGIDMFGIVDTLVARAEDKLVIGGHQRRRLAIKRKMKQVPVLFVEGLTEAETKALVVLLNNPAAQGSWDMLKLTELISDLDAHGFDATLTGFDLPEISALLGGSGSKIRPEADVNDAPAKPKKRETVAKPGEVWRCGRHLVCCGDSKDPAAWQRALGSRRADAVWTDPPYGVAYVGKTAEKLTIENDGMDEVALHELLSKAFALAAQHCRPGASWAVAAPHGPPFHVFGAVLKGMGIWRQTLLWIKDRFVLGRSDFHYQHEAIFAGGIPDAADRGDDDATSMFYGWSPDGAHSWFGDRRASTVIECARPSASRLHPTMKPVELIEAMLRRMAPPNGTVVDPFGGSGSTMLAAEKLGMRAVLIELDPGYVDVITGRWAAATGEAAELVK